MLEPRSCLRRACPRLLLACAVAGALSGCGGRLGPGGSAAGDDGGAAGDDGGAGDDGSVTSPGPPGSPCPAAVPGATASCSALGIVCEYGTDPLPSCDTLATCLGTRWSIAPPTCTPSPQPPGGCPATMSGLTPGATCSPVGAECDY